VSTIAGWLREGSHRLLRWETDWSSQTGASQAGLLHGSNDDMPAFRWFEKERGAPMVSNHPRDAMEIERRHSDGRGLLAGDGASRANVFSGDAPRSSLTMSTVLRRDRGGLFGHDYYAYFANPYNVVRTMVLAIREIVLELWNASEQHRRNLQPRVSRRFPYPLVRAWTCVIQRDLQCETVMADIYAGRPVIYTDLLGYDEVAHHSGTQRRETLAVLKKIDRQLARIAGAARDARRPYTLVVISDHGQTQGPTFRQRWGQTLEDLVRKACADGSVHGSVLGDESWGYLAGSLTEAAGGTGFAARMMRTATRSKTSDGIVELGPNASRRKRSRNPIATAEPLEIVVMGSGCLGLIYFPRRPGRLTLEEIEQAYPDLIPALRTHPGIGFLLVRSSRRGAVVLGPRGVNYLDEGKIEGEDPLTPFGPTANRHVKRTDGFSHAADIMVNSAYDPQREEVFAFEELVGSHGGMGGPQSYPFVLVPHDWTPPDEPIIGAESMHKWMRRWIEDLGQRRPAGVT
jgi:Type I phosphodiesterase / nucleotide pyrophosphatase